MITLEHDRLVFRFPDVHAHAICSIDLQRTLRIPDDDKDYPLPPGLGSFPLRHLDDFAEPLSAAWRERGGVIMPMHQAEAMWLNFGSHSGELGVQYPFAIKVATGKINAVSGETWFAHLNCDPQDYLVIPTQPWLDGYCVEKGSIRQFIAMPLGDGYSVEEQLTGAAEHGGLQIMVWPMKASRYEALVSEERRRAEQLREDTEPVVQYCLSPMEDMGLAPGGRMRQEIYEDRHGLDAWDQRHSSRCFVTIANSTQWMAITGDRPPTEPPTAEDYTRRGLPWFDYYDADAEAIEGADRLGKIRSVRQRDEAQGLRGWKNSVLGETPRVRQLGPRKPRQVREARF